MSTENRAISSPFKASALLHSLQAAPEGLTLAELLAQHPGLTRRTAQRWLGDLVAAGQVQAQGEGRARRYLAASGAAADFAVDRFPAFIPLSPDSRDVLAYVQQPLAARKPVGYQREFLESYEPNRSCYLPEPLRRQLHRLGRTSEVQAPAGTYSRAILNRLLIDLSWASSHLEGNTYSRLDTRELIEHGRAAQGKAAIETQMILNHKAAIELLVENIDSVGFNRYTVMNLHSALSENLLPNPADEGRIRQHAVDIGQSVYRPLSTPQPIDDLLDQLLDKANRIEDPFEQSFFMMVQLPYLQPFEDVNKRVSRIGANLPLIQHNLCPLSFIDVPERAYIEGTLAVYELNQVALLRDVFVWAYERSCQRYLAIAQTMVEPDPLKIKYREGLIQAVQTVVKGLMPPSPEVIAEVAQDHAEEADQAAFREMLTEALQQLHEGSIARYRLRRSEYIAWQHAHGQA